MTTFEQIEDFEVQTSFVLFLNQEFPDFKTLNFSILDLSTVLAT